MAQWYRAFVKVPHSNGLPADTIQNTYAFVTAGTGDRVVIATEIDTRLTAFYSAFSTQLSSTYVWNNSTIEVVDMTDPKPRIPFYSAALSVTAPTTGNQDMPPEVAVVLSFQGAKVSGVNMRRRRGRVYVGPLSIGASDFPTAPSGLYNAVATSAGTNLLNYTPRLTEWAVYSPYTHHDIPVGEKLTKDDEEVPDLLPASFTVVERCWVDNAWDTQRRRGTKASTRTTVVHS